MATMRSLAIFTRGTSTAGRCKDGARRAAAQRTAPASDLGHRQVDLVVGVVDRLERRPRGLGQDRAQRLEARALEDEEDAPPRVRLDVLRELLVGVLLQEHRL